MVSWLLMVAEYWLALHFLGATLTPAQTIIALTAARRAEDQTQVMLATYRILKLREQ